MENDCKQYVEDPCICYGDGEPKGQCATCGAKWWDHELDALPHIDRQNYHEIREHQRGLEKERNEPNVKKEQE